MYLVLCNSLLEKRNRKKEKKRIWLEERQEKRVWWRHREMDEPGGTRWCKVRLEEKRSWRRPLELKPQTCPWLLTWAVCGSKLSLLFERQGCWAVTFTAFPITPDQGLTLRESSSTMCWLVKEMMPANAGLSAHGRNVILGFLLLP